MKGEYAFLAKLTKTGDTFLVIGSAYGQNVQSGQPRTVWRKGKEKNPHFKRKYNKSRMQKVQILIEMVISMANGLSA